MLSKKCALKKHTIDICSVLRTMMLAEVYNMKAPSTAADNMDGICLVVCVMRIVWMHQRTGTCALDDHTTQHRHATTKKADKRWRDCMCAVAATQVVRLKVPGGAREVHGDCRGKQPAAGHTQARGGWGGWQTARRWPHASLPRVGCEHRVVVGMEHVECTR